MLFLQSCNIIYLNLFFIFITDNAELTKHDINTTIAQKKKTPVNIPFTTDRPLQSIDHRFLTNDEKLDYLIGELYTKVENWHKNKFYFSFIELEKINIKKGNVILQKINDLQTCFNDLDISGCTKKNKIDVNDDEHENIARFFPLEDIENVNSFEEKLKNKEFYKQVVHTFFYF